jgi:type I restriction enzyme R subunit
VRAQYLRKDATVDWEGVSMKVKQLLDSRIDAEVRELMKPVSILDTNFQEKISELPHDEARASVMEHAIRAQIKERIAENPAFYEKLSQQLERIIAEMKQRIIDAAEACRRMARLREEALSVTEAASEQGLTDLSFAVYELLEQSTARGSGSNGEGPAIREQPAGYGAAFDDRLKSIAMGIEQVMNKGRAIVDWQSKEDVQRVMRRDIKRELRKLHGLMEEEIEELARNMVEIARRKAARG